MHRPEYGRCFLYWYPCRCEDSISSRDVTVKRAMGLEQQVGISSRMFCSKTSLLAMWRMNYIHVTLFGS